MQENNKRIAKNTIYLYIRLLFNMAVSLYTSRVILATLGVDDFGLNAVVTSAITIFSFINGSMASATSRFLTFELGRGDFERLGKTFSCALTVHFLIALFIFILGETVGLWYLENKMVIPEGRITAARWVYQLSLINSILTITQVPYNASIMSHEKMNVYAYIEILKTGLMLGIVYLLVIGNFDKLILYAVLTLCVSVVITIIYRIYCIRHFEECKYKFIWDKSVLRPMLSFSGWDLFGNLSFSAKNQWVTIVINIFFSLSINAAYAIANQVSNVANLFAANIYKAIAPQIIKYYANKEYGKMQELIINSSLFPFLLLFTISLPILLETKFILHLWLKQVPDNTELFLQLFIVSTLIYSFGTTINIATNATAKIKVKTIWLFFVSILVPSISYIFFKFGCTISYLPIILVILANVMFVIILLKECCKNIPWFSIIYFLKQTFFVILKITFIACFFTCPILVIMDEGYVRFILIVIISTLSMVIFTYFIALKRTAKEKIKYLLLARLYYLRNKKYI